LHGATYTERGGGGQQPIQPRQTDDESSLLKLGVVRKEWCDDEGRKNR
jgi:hypothetical protein